MSSKFADFFKAKMPDFGDVLARMWTSPQVQGGINTFVHGVADKVTAIAADPEAIKRFASELKANSHLVAAATVVGTPAEPHADEVTKQVIQAAA